MAFTISPQLEVVQVDCPEPRCHSKFEDSDVSADRELVLRFTPSLSRISSHGSRRSRCADSATSSMDIARRGLFGAGLERGLCKFGSAAAGGARISVSRRSTLSLPPGEVSGGLFQAVAERPGARAELELFVPDPLYTARSVGVMEVRPGEVRCRVRWL